MGLPCACAGGGMKTLNRKGHQERRKLIREGVDPLGAYQKALADTENHSRFGQRKKK